jgi:hypothetical protein
MVVLMLNSNTILIVISIVTTLISLWKMYSMHEKDKIDLATEQERRFTSLETYMQQFNQRLASFENRLGRLEEFAQTINHNSTELADIMKKLMEDKNNTKTA